MPLAAWWEKHGWKVEPLLTLLGIYGVKFLVTRVAVATAPNLAVARPIKGLAAWLFTSWDAEHYLRLARNYDSYAWPPLYPMALRLIAAVGVDVQVAAVVVNLLAHLAIVYLAFAFVRGNERFKDVPGWLFASLILFFPGHNVFFAGYSESLFLALLLGACVAYQRERLWVAGLLCGLSLLTRNMGLFLGVALVAVEVARSVREKRFRFARLIAVALWVPFFVGWNVWLTQVASTNPVAATLDWQIDLLQHHVPHGDNPKLWVLRFIALPPGNHNEFVFFWGLVVAVGYCWRRKLLLEAALIAIFLLSFAAYLYRPFPFTRYASVLFPLALMVADATRKVPALQALAVSIGVALSHHYEVMLFSDRFGEP
ncbi:MAG: mannosyltransferase family protein [Archangium sp.]|nr:mannosyltransferase family protein [Archangium sp.]